MATRHVDTVTGVDRTTQFGFNGTDLGYLTLTNHGYVLATFGDTSEAPWPGEPGWRSPVILRTSNRDLDNSIKWDNAVGGSYAKQVINYQRDFNPATNSADRPFTYIPNDVVHLPDGRYLMSAFAVQDWDYNTRNGFWTHANRFFTSTQRDAEHWETATWADLGTPHTLAMQFNNDAGAWRVFQNATFILRGDYLYMFGTESGRTIGGGIYLARVPWREWDRLFSWQFWGWTGNRWEWGAPSATPILMPSLETGAIGEINAQDIDGNVVLAYMEYSGNSREWSIAVTRTAAAPDGIWTAPKGHTTSLHQQNPYAPSIHPYSTMDQGYMVLSQWTGNVYYGVHLYALDGFTPAGDDSDIPDLSSLQSVGEKTDAANRFARGDVGKAARILAKAVL